MNEQVRRGCAILGLSTLRWPAIGQAQLHQHHPAKADTTSHRRPKPAAHQHEGMAHEGTHGGMDMSGMDMGEMPMTGLYGPYAMSREASGTAWQPEAARHEGIHIMRGAWMAMLHGSADLAYDKQGGHRGDEKVFSDNMGMGMAQRLLGPRRGKGGRLGWCGVGRSPAWAGEPGRASPVRAFGRIGFTAPRGRFCDGSGRNSLLGGTLS